MALKITANADHVVQLAVAYGRLDNFGYKGWRLLAEAMEEMSDDIGQDIEVDIVGWCCEYSHASSADAAFEELQHYSEWNIEQPEWDEMDDDEKLEAVKEFLQYNTTLVVCEDGCIIWASF